MIKRLIQAALARAGVGIYRIQGRHAQDGLVTLHGDRFRDDPEFLAAYHRGVAASRGVDPGFEWRVHIALWAARTALRVPGDFVECGVNAGFVSSAIMHKLSWNSTGRRFYLIDTFAGPVLSQFSGSEVRANRRDFAEQAVAAGAYVQDLPRIRQNFAEWQNVTIVPGAVPEVLHGLEFGAIAFLHIDMNCAFPERAALEFFWDRLSPGAMVLFDDYCYFGHECQREAIDAAARERGAEVLSLPTGQGLIVR